MPRILVYQHLTYLLTILIIVLVTFLAVLFVVNWVLKCCNFLTVCSGKDSMPREKTIGRYPLKFHCAYLVSKPRGVMYIEIVFPVYIVHVNEWVIYFVWWFVIVDSCQVTFHLCDMDTRSLLLRLAMCD